MPRDTEASLIGCMARAYRDPRRAMAAVLAAGPDEGRGIMHLMLACGLSFVASVPNAVRSAGGLAVDDPVTGAVAAHLFGYFVLLPLLAYGVAALVHLVARGCGGKGGFGAARAAVFWALLLAAPIALGLAGAGVAAEAAGAGRLPVLTFLGYAGLGLWLWLLAASLAEAEGFAATGGVAAIVIGAFGGIAAIFAALAGDFALAA